MGYIRCPKCRRNKIEQITYMKGTPMKHSAIERIKKICQIVFTASICVVALYMIASAVPILKLEIRTWLQVLFRAAAVFGIPLSMLSLCICVLAEKLERLQKIRQRILPALGMCMLLVLCVADIFVGGFWLFFSVGTLEKERKISADVLQGTSTDLMGKAVGVRYAKPVALFWKEPYLYDDEAVVLAIFEERYGEDFEVWSKGPAVDDNRQLQTEYTIEEAADGQVIFHAAVLKGMTPGYYDDYPQMRAGRRAREYGQQYFPKRMLKELPDEKSPGLSKGIAVVCQDRKDISKCAEDTAKAIAYIMEDTFFQTYGAEIYIECGQDTEDVQELELTFGNHGKEKQKEKQGVDRESIQAWLTNVYSNMTPKQEKETEETETEESETTEPESEAGREPETETTELKSETAAAAEEKTEAEEQESLTAQDLDGQGFLTPEGAYDKLYQAVFEPNGDAYECTYNAKGNFYAVLGNGKETVDGKEMDIRRTVVYDRISKNGKCQLFVAYQEYYNEDGSEYTTKILNFYGVDIRSGAVVAGNKTAWAETASKEYQEMTGEK